jgi:CMP-N-acetylneuraminic acid synthetase
MKWVTALIPARSGSKRIPGKNIVEIGGVPLLTWSIIAALNAGEIHEVYVSSDDANYLRIASEAGAKTILRPQALAGDDTTDYEVVDHAIRTWDDNRALMPDFIAYLRPTTPFRMPVILDEAISLWQNINDSFDSLRSVELLQESAFKTFTRGPVGNLVGLLRSMNEASKPDQAYEQTYKGNGYIDIVKSTLPPGLWGERIYGFETDPVIEIDRPFDLELAQLSAEREKVNATFTYRSVGRVQSDR